jgi:hypothetical protein
MAAQAFDLQYRKEVSSTTVANNAFIMVPEGIQDFSIWGKVTGAATTGNNIEMTADSAEEVRAGTATWIAVVAGLTTLTNTSYLAANAKVFNNTELTVTAFRAVWGDASTSVELLITAVKGQGSA